MRSLDFIVIGAQKAGTTTLWQLLRWHPSISMPQSKEEPFFCYAESESPEAFVEFMATRFADAGEGALLGKATPQYMTGSEQLDVGEIARRISTAIPEVRLIVLLRDPIERATSHYRMSVRRGWEERPLDTALAAQLDPAALTAGREHPTETNSYVAQGEYGRVLRAYRSHFPAEQLHVELTAELDRDPGGVLDRVLPFLSLPPGFRPPRLNVRLHRGGTQPLLDAESKASLLEFMEENVWSKLGEDRKRLARLFAAFLAIWDIAPAEEPPRISAETRGRLEAHYESDAEALADLGHAAPWLNTWPRTVSSS
jgi:Sulfotransferase domain